jgi:crotonobetainyl-CoA:carnitine CoA-transferase CaiB-like acyl-CoA transferase
VAPLAGIKVLDFSTLLPGPLATLILTEAGAEVVKIERPEGEDMWRFPPLIAGESVPYALLNRGKSVMRLDLKSATDLASARRLMEAADIVVEQFRPGVMARLGLDFEGTRRRNPRLIYCSITGYGQTGPMVQTVGHDLTYLAETGILAQAADATGTPIVPPVLAADIAGGSYAAVINILLALRQRDRDGQGCHLDIAMTEQLFPFAFLGLAEIAAAGRAPPPGGGPLTGGSPRYQVYRAACGGFLAVAPLEEKFWRRFCALIALDARWIDDAGDPAGTRAAVAAKIAEATAEVWFERFRGEDVCVGRVLTLDEAIRQAQVLARGLFDRRVAIGGRSVPALPVPVVPSLRSDP